MFVSKKGDVLILDDGAYQVIDQIEHKGQEYIILMSMTEDIDVILNHRAPMFVAKEVVKEDSEDLLVDFVEDQKLIDEIRDLFDFDD